MKRAKTLLQIIIYSLPLVLTVEPAIAKQEVPASTVASIPGGYLQVDNEDSFKLNQVNVVDIFPEQSWASLRAETTNTLTQIPAPPVVPVETLQLPPPLPFTVVGEWLEDSQHIVVLESMGETYLVCNRCELSNAIKEGDKLAQKYLVKSIDNKKLILMNEHGEEQYLTY